MFENKHAIEMDIYLNTHIFKHMYRIGLTILQNRQSGSLSESSLGKTGLVSE